MPTHFEIFKLTPSVDVDAQALDQKFRDLSLKHHPDRVEGTDPKARRQALEQTMALNEAHKTLKDPIKRAFYLLKLQGHDLDREDAGAQKGMPLEFLEEVMELREQLEGLKAQKNLERARAMAAEVQQRQRTALEEARKNLTERLRNPGDEPALQGASYALSRVRYFTRFLDEVEKMEDEALS